MKRFLMYVLVIFAGFLLQNNLFAESQLISTVPNIMLIITFSFGFIRGSNDGMLIGFVCGLISDMFFGESIGMTALIFTLVGYVNGILGQLYYAEFINMPLVICLISDLLYNICTYFFSFFLRGRTAVGYYCMHIVLPELLYTALLTALLYPLLLWLNRKMEKWETKNVKRIY